MYASICLIVFAARMNILFIIKVKILMLVRWSYRSPQSCELLNLAWLAFFEHIFQSLLNTCLSNVGYLSSITCVGFRPIHPNEGESEPREGEGGRKLIIGEEHGGLLF